MDCDVIVVGAGPAGSHVARLLAEGGHGVVLVDENDGPRQRIVCTGIIGREAYERMDLPKNPIVDVVASAAFVSPAGTRVSHEPQKPMAFVVDRTAFDGAMQTRATDAGATLCAGHAAREVTKQRSHIRLTAKVNRRKRAITSRALVVATGHQRWMHEGSGLGVPQAYVHGVHADLPFTELNETEVHFGNDIAPGHFAWAVPFGKGLARLGVLSPQGSHRYFSQFIRTNGVRERLAIEPEEDRVQTHLHSRAIVQGPVRPSFSDRVIAVGEAAGQVKTTTAGGIYYGMLGAEIAAEILDDSLRRDRLQRSDLQRYEDRWWERLGGEIKWGLELQRFARSMEDDQIDRLFEALNDGLGAAVRQVVDFDWHRPALVALFKRKKVWRSLLKRNTSIPFEG